MDYTQNMFLESATGYAMPFNDPQGNPRIFLGYGKQIHPKTKDEFFHRGVDFDCKNQQLYALASGVVSGVLSDRKTGFQIVVTYGDYDVTYRPIAQAKVNIGQSVNAGQPIAVSGNYLHMSVTYKGEDLDPMELLQMVYANMASIGAAKGDEKVPVMDSSVETKYDKDNPEIEGMMKKYFIPYFIDMIRGSYKAPDRTTSTLKNLFMYGKTEGMYYKSIPSLANPLGINSSASTLVSMFLNVLIDDFLNYMAQRHRIFLSSWDEEQKQNFMEGMM